MLAYHHPELPPHLNAAKYEHLTVCIDVLVPACKATHERVPKFRLAGSAGRSLPLLAYADGSYFRRCFALLIQRAKSRSKLQRHYESDMAQLLKKMALADEDIAWLPRSSVVEEIARGELAMAGAGTWCLEFELRVYRDVTARNTLVPTLWQHPAMNAWALSE